MVHWLRVLAYLSSEEHLEHPGGILELEDAVYPFIWIRFHVGFVGGTFYFPGI